jgi:hypothetical protein
MLPTTEEVHMSRSKGTPSHLESPAPALARAATTTRAATIEQLIRLQASDASVGAQLTHIILADLQLTSRLLHAVNSYHCNPERVRIATISRAVSVLGFHGVRRPALVVALLEDCAHGVQRARALACFARSIHAAAQARGIAAYRADIDPEEAFVVALLRDAGELQFWSSGGAVAAHIDRALAEPDVDARAAEERIFGRSLAALAAPLNPYASALPLLRAALANGTSTDPRVRCIQLAHALARCAEDGWPGEQLRRLCEEAIREMAVPAADVSNALRAHAHEAACLAAACEAVEVGRLIRRP